MTCGSHVKKKKLKSQMAGRTNRMKGGDIRFYFFFYLLSSQIHENLTVGIRRDKHEKCSTRQGLRVGTKNKGFHREFRQKFGKIQIFSFS